MRVLVIEDDVELAEAIGAGLRQEQMAVDVATDGTTGLDRALCTDYDVIVLDRDLPGRHGDEVCAELVRAGARSRVLMLTAAATIEDRVGGLGLGADDYLPKPFAFAELTARLRALLRRAQPPLAPVLASGELRLDPARRSASRRGQPLELGPKEFGVLELFRPFQRMDPARRAPGGLGLGLAIVQAIAAAHGAGLHAVTRAAGGLAIEIRFPPAPPPAGQGSETPDSVPRVVVAPGIQVVVGAAGTTDRSG